MSNDYSKKALSYLIDQNLFGKDSKYVCDVCINYGLERLTVKKHSEEAINKQGTTDNREAIGDVGVEMRDGNGFDDIGSSDVATEEVQIDEDVEEITPDDLTKGASTVEKSNQSLLGAADTLINGLLSNNIMVDHVLSKKLDGIVYLVVKRILRPAITENCKNMQNSYKDIIHLQNLNSKDFLDTCNTSLIRFLSGCPGRNIEFILDSKMLYRFSVVVESIHHLKNSNAILPHCFAMNLIQKQISGSKTVTAVNGKVLPSSGDSALRYWWEQQASRQLTIPRSVDIAIYFDNVGKYIVKSFRVKAERNDSRRL